MAQTAGYFQHYSAEERKVLPEFVDYNLYRYPKDYNTVGKILAGENHDIIILRAGTQSQNANTATTDSQFTVSNVAKYRNAGLRVGTYYYARHINTYTTNGGWSEANAIVDATSHANNYANILETVFGAGKCGDMLPCIDFEDNRIYNDGAYVTTAQILYVWLKAFSDRMKVRFPQLSSCMLYTAYYYIDACSSTNDIRHSVDGGIANIYPKLWYSANACYTGIHGATTYPNYNYTLFGDYTKWTMWQYSTDRNFLTSEFELNTSAVENGMDINVFDTFNFDVEDVMVYPVVKPALLKELDNKATRSHTHKGDYLPLQGGSLTGRTNIINPDALILKQEENKSWKLGRTSTSIANTHVAGDLQLVPSTDYFAPGSVAGETWNTSKILFKEDASIECTDVKIGGNSVLTTASVIADVGSSTLSTYENLLTNSLTGQIDIGTMYGTSAFNQKVNGNCDDVTKWNTNLQGVTASVTSNTLRYTTTAANSTHQADNDLYTIDSATPWIGGRKYAISFDIVAISGCKLTCQVHHKTSSGSYEIQGVYLLTSGSGTQLFTIIPSSVHATTPQTLLRFALTDTSDNSTWTGTGNEYVTVANVKVVDLTAVGLGGVATAELLDRIGRAPYFQGRGHCDNITFTSLNNGKTLSKSITYDDLEYPPLKRLSSTVRDMIVEDDNYFYQNVLTVSNKSYNTVINSTNCPSIKTSGAFFAYNDAGQYTYGTQGATLAFSNTTSPVTIEYERFETNYIGNMRNAILECYDNAYFRMSGGLLPTINILFPRNLAGVVRTNSKAIDGVDYNIGLIEDKVFTQKLVTKSTAGDEYIRFLRVKTVKATGDAYSRVFYKFDLSHTGTYGKSGELQFLFYKVTGHNALHANSYAWIVNDAGMPYAFASGDIVYQNWVPSTGTIGYTDVYIKTREFASLYYSIQHSFSENSSTGGSNFVEFLPTGTALLSAIPTTSSTTVIGGVTCTAEAAVNATVKTITMT
jgi:hypothetical protein